VGKNNLGASDNSPRIAIRRWAAVAQVFIHKDTNGRWKETLSENDCASRLPDFFLITNMGVVGQLGLPQHGRKLLHYKSRLFPPVGLRAVAGYFDNLSPSAWGRIRG
jgi:hypothetical protein